MVAHVAAALRHNDSQDLSEIDDIVPLSLREPISQTLASGATESVCDALVMPESLSYARTVAAHYASEWRQIGDNLGSEYELAGRGGRSAMLKLGVGEFLADRIFK